MEPEEQKGREVNLRTATHNRTPFILHDGRPAELTAQMQANIDSNRLIN